MLSLSFLGFRSQAQEKSEGVTTSKTISFKSSQGPKWISEKGFWVVESNIHQPRKSIIYFYNNKKELVYKELITDEKFKLHKRKTLIRIKNTLETVLIAWDKGQPISENEGFFIAAKNK